MDAFNFAKQTALSIKRPSNGAANNGGRNTWTNVNGATRGKHPDLPYRKHNLLEEYWNKLIWFAPHSRRRRV